MVSTAGTIELSYTVKWFGFAKIRTCDSMGQTFDRARRYIRDVMIS